MEAKSTVMATQNVVHFPTEYHDAPFFEPRDVPDIHYIKDKLRRIDPAANRSYRKDPESDISNAQLLAKLINGRAVYVEGQGWYVFCGGRWCFDKEQLRLMIICQEISKQLVAYINELPMDEGKKKYLAAAKKWDKLSYRKKLLEDAASKRFINQDVFDKQPNKFNCLNGTLDLCTGEFSEHAPNDMLTQMSNVAFDPEAKCERWERYVAEIMKDDTEMIEFLQKSFGYALSGENPYECMFLLLGLKTRNGKGVLTGTFEHMLGDYSTTSNPEAIFGKGANNGNEHSEGVARLFRKRFIAVHELEKGYTLNARKIKSFTGNDTITARVLYSNSFEFKPQGKVYVSTNSLPKVNDKTLFTSGRLVLIPFEQSFPSEEQDRGLKNELIRPENINGIFNWCYRGFQMLQETGFTMPDKVRNAIDAYASEENEDRCLDEYFAEMLTPDPSGEMRTTDLCADINYWLREAGYEEVKQRDIASYLKAKNLLIRDRPKDRNNGMNKTSLVRGYRKKTRTELMSEGDNGELQSHDMEPEKLSRYERRRERDEYMTSLESGRRPSRRHREF